MQFYLIDDDPAVLNILRMILEDMECGSVLGCASSGVDALEELKCLRPDIVLVDLLMPGMDGIEFVRRAKAEYPGLRFVMLSQVTSKDMVAEAYETGVDFFITKPINSVEVANVIERVSRQLTMDRTMEQMRSLVRGEPERRAAARTGDSTQNAVSGVLHRLGISGDPASRDIIQVVECIVKAGAQGEQYTVSQLCEKFSDSPKTMEQRIRRAAMATLSNLASMGIEDYGNEVFSEYASTLFPFEQVRREMDYIRGKSSRHGKVSVKNFLYALAAVCTERH